MPRRQMTLVDQKRRFTPDSSDQKPANALRQLDSLSSIFTRSATSTPKSLIEILQHASPGLPSTFDLAWDMYIHSGVWSRQRGIPTVPLASTCSLPAKSSSNTSHSTGGSRRAQISRKRTPRKSRGRKTTITSTTSDTFSWLFLISLRWRLLQRYLMPNNEWWRSIFATRLSLPTSGHLLFASPIESTQRSAHDTSRIPVGA